MLTNAKAALLSWLDRVVAQNAGGDLTILYHIEPDYPLEVLRVFHRRLRTVAGIRFE